MSQPPTPTGSDRVARLLNLRKDNAAAANEQAAKTGKVGSGEQAGKAKNLPGILISNIIPDPDQPRKVFDEDKLNELAVSIKARGVIQPITVEQLEDEGKYIVVDGERRWRAAQIAGLIVIPAYVKNNVAVKVERLIDALVVNIHRENLKPIEKANAIVEIQRLYPKMTDRDLAKKVGISPRMLYRLLNIHKLPEHILDKFYSEGLNDRHAKALLMLKEHSQLQEELLDDICVKKIPGDTAISLADEWLAKLAQKSPITKYYNGFVDKFTKLEKKLPKFGDVERSKMLEQIKSMRRTLELLETKLNDQKLSE